MRAPITLLYHAILPAPANADLEERRLFVHPDLFGKQMEIMSRRGYRTLRLCDYAAGLEAGRFPERSFLLSFDDGYAHVPEAVTPVLRRFDYCAVMFVPTAHLGGKNVWDTDHPNLAILDLLAPDDLCELNGGAWEVASHGSVHSDLSTISSDERCRGLIEARDYLSDLLGQPVVDLAYPYGIEDEPVRADARRAGYRMAFAARQSRSADRYRLPRRPVRGDLSLGVFRLITSVLAEPLYAVRQ